METITLNSLKRMFPRTGNALCATTGYIPMDYFNANEPAIRAAMRTAGCSLRVWYRGPRTQRGSKPSATLRKNATHAVIYRF
jgi:hypothetical protein